VKKTRETDARTLTAKELTALRIRGVSAVQGGQSPEVVAKALCISRASIYAWLALYRSGGWHALDAAKRGGRKPKLNGKIMQWLFNVVTMKNPMQFQFAFALWTREMILALLKERYGITLSKTSISKLLDQLGLSAQRPLWRAYQQNPEAVDRWLKKEFPAIKRRAAKEKAEIFFGDEAGVRSDHHSGTTWARRGKTPIVSTTGARFGFNMLSAISSRGSLRFMVVEGKVGADVFIQFLKNLIKGATRPIYLIVDGHPMHKAKKVKAFVESTLGKLTLFHLPGYAPELNPDELVWNNLKNHALGKIPHSDKEAMMASAKAHMRKLQRNPKIIQGFFQKETTKYAA